MLTDSQARALGIILDFEDREERGIMPREFARRMWPDSDGWQRRTKAGPKGVSIGGGMNLAAGAFLGKLARAGFSKVSYKQFGGEHTITKAGRDALAEYNVQRGEGK